MRDLCDLAGNNLHADRRPSCRVEHPRRGVFQLRYVPSIFTLGLAELGPLAGDGSGILNMAIVGGAVVPLAQGYIADRIGIHHAFFLARRLLSLHPLLRVGRLQPNSQRRAVPQGTGTAISS